LKAAPSHGASVFVRLAVPLLHAGEAIGTIALRRAEVRPFTDRQVELLKTFAEQAVIAIENVQLFRELENADGPVTTVVQPPAAGFPHAKSGLPQPPRRPDVEVRDRGQRFDP
jgi:transcriptional regulator with GAF, ATPase, and Fis domain